MNVIFRRRGCSLRCPKLRGMDWDGLIRVLLKNVTYTVHVRHMDSRIDPETVTPSKGSISGMTAQRRGSTDELDVPFSIRSRQRVESVHSNQPQRGKTFDEHFNSLGWKQRRSCLPLSGAYRRSETSHHPLVWSSTLRQLLGNYSAGVHLAAEAVEERAAILNEAASLPCSLNEFIWTITFPYLNARLNHTGH